MYDIKRNKSLKTVEKRTLSSKIKSKWNANIFQTIIFILFFITLTKIINSQPSRNKTVIVLTSDEQKTYTTGLIQNFELKAIKKCFTKIRYSTFFSLINDVFFWKDLHIFLACIQTSHILKVLSILRQAY